MLRGYNLVPWENITLPIKEANQLLKDHYTYGWTLQVYFSAPRTCPQERDWNEFVDGFKLLPICVQEMILHKLHGKIVVCSLQNYILYISTYCIIISIQKMASNNSMCYCFNKGKNSSSD